jgi:hypothetical protein
MRRWSRCSIYPPRRHHARGYGARRRKPDAGNRPARRRQRGHRGPDAARAQPAPEGSYFHDTTQASGVFTVAGTAYAVLLAFVFLLAFQSYNSARSAAEGEATATAWLYHDADAFQAPIAVRLHGEVVCYARSVIYQEWPAMADGHASPVTEFWLARLDRTIGTEQPRTVKQGNADFTGPPSASSGSAGAATACRRHGR